VRGYVGDQKRTRQLQCGGETWACLTARSLIPPHVTRASERERVRERERREKREEREREEGGREGGRESVRARVTCMTFIGYVSCLVESFIAYVVHWNLLAYLFFWNSYAVGKGHASPGNI